MNRASERDSGTARLSRLQSGRASAPRALLGGSMGSRRPITDAASGIMILFAAMIAAAGPATIPPIVPAHAVPPAALRTGPEVSAAHPTEAALRPLQSDSVLVRFLTEPTGAGVEVERARGAMLFLKTPDRFILPRRERISYVVRLDGYHSEQGTIDLRAAADTVDVRLALISDRRLLLLLDSDPPADSVWVRADGGRTIAAGGADLRTWLDKAAVVLHAIWSDGSRCAIDEDFRSISGRKYARVLEPEYREVDLIVRANPPAMLVLRPMAGTQVVRAFDSLSVHIAKDVMVIHAQWPDGETRREELNLLALRGRRYEHQIWKRRERSPVDVRAVPGGARLILVATDGSETVEARDRVEGWLARRPYAVRARWQDGASADTLLTPGAGDTAAVQSLTVCPEPKANALPTAATPDSAEAGEMNPGKPPSGLSPR